MAAINAYGAHEMARVKAVSSKFGVEREFVMASDGRILTRFYSAEWRLERRHVPLTLRNRAGLTELVEALGYQVKP